MVLLYVMTLLADTVIYDIVSGILTAAQGAFSAKELRELESYISHGPAAEDCCSLLVAYPTRVYPGFGNETSKDFRTYVYLVDIIISLRECPPPMGPNGEAPIPEENDSYAELASTHAFKIVKALILANKAGSLMPNGECDFTIPPSAEIIEEQGQCAGWDITMTVQLSS